jgi:hypothetical protein
MIIQGFELETLKPDTVVLHGTKRYIKVKDEVNCHIEGYLLDVKTGVLIHWSQITFFNTEIEIEEELKS